MSTVESKIADKPGASKREETLSLGQIDEEYLSNLIKDQVAEFDNSHVGYFKAREEWLLALRDLRYQYREGYFEHASDLHVPYTLTMIKALHARLFQAFSQRNFFSIEARNIAFEGQEPLIKTFMDWGLHKWTNRGEGWSDVLDIWLNDILDEGSGIVKLGWDRWEHNFLDLEIEMETEEFPDILAGLGRDGEGVADFGTSEKSKAKIKNKKKKLKLSAPRIWNVPLEDFKMPAGDFTVQSAPWILHRIYLQDDQMKERAAQKKFDPEVVEEAIERRAKIREDFDQDKGQQTKRRRRELEGVTNNQYSSESNKFDLGVHEIWEYYARVYVTPDMDDDTLKSLKKRPEEIVIWYHKGIEKILGWTYLYRLNPSGRRPFYKPDYMKSKERAYGLGVGELLFSINNHIDGVHNLKLDNGVLSSLQFGLYRAGSTMKPDTFRLRPGDLVPVEDPNDVKFANFPYLGQFGQQEEAVLTEYGNKMLAINDINLGNISGSGVAGALRNATGASFVDKQANIQLNPILDRIAREMKRLLADFFLMARGRMDATLSFRVTGEDGKGIFKNVSDQDLRGDFDINIDTDLASASDAEKQQRASLMLQTLNNPTFMQLGIIQPGNQYEMLKEFLIRHGVRNPDQYITKPQNYSGPPMTPEQRIFKIVVGEGESPMIEDTIRPEENHERAIEFYEGFKDSEKFGLLASPMQVAALEAVIERHQAFLSATQGAAGLPNMAGTQISPQGLQGQDPSMGIPGAGDAEQGPLGSPLGEVNGPVL